jgi:hypothetical protein
VVQTGLYNGYAEARHLGDRFSSLFSLIPVVEP